MRVMTKTIFFSIIFSLILQAENCHEIINIIYKQPHKIDTSAVEFPEYNLLPSTFDFDSVGNIYIVNNFSKRINVLKSNVLEKTVAFSEKTVNKILYHNNTLITFSVPDKINQYSLSTEDVMYSYTVAEKEDLIDYFVSNNELFLLISKSDKVNDEFVDIYTIEKISLDTYNINRHKLNIETIKKPLHYSPFIYNNSKTFYIPVENKIFSFDINSCKRKQTCLLNEKMYFDGLLYCNDDSSITISWDGPPTLKFYNKDCDLIEALNLVNPLESFFNGKFGKDFMFGNEGWVYDLKYHNQNIYLMCSTKFYTYILQLYI